MRWNEAHRTCTAIEMSSIDITESDQFNCYIAGQFEEYGLILWSLTFDGKKFNIQKIQEYLGNLSNVQIYSYV